MVPLTTLTCIVLALLLLLTPSALSFSTPTSTYPRSTGIGRRVAYSSLLRAVESPNSIVTDGIQKFDVGNNGDCFGSSNRDDLANQLIKTCKKFGQVGSKLNEEDRANIDDIASMLSAFSEPAPAKFDLKGTHDLVYSASPGGSSGAIGPFVGKVTQSFLNKEKFINRVELLNGIFKQIMVITHIQDLQNAFEKRVLIQKDQLTGSHVELIA